MLAEVQFQPPGVGDLSNAHTAQFPAIKYLLQLLLKPLLNDHQHPLLRLRQQYFIGAHARFAQGHFVDLQAHSRAPFGGHFAAAASDAGSAHVLHAD